jgi:hypothetical protein
MVDGCLMKGIGMSEIITEEQVQELMECASEEGSEWGDSIYALCTLYHQARYLSDEFYEAYKRELKSEYDQMILNTKVVTKKERVVYPERTYREWN